MISQDTKNGENFINFVKIRQNAMVPVRGSLTAAGADLHACLETSIELYFGDLILVPTGIAIELPSPEFAGFIFARSGLGIKYGVIPSNAVGVIDSDYRGEIMVGLCKVSKNEKYVINHGDRIAQLIIIKTENLGFKEVDILSQTQRGEQGFGSTGK
ncbi:MAG: dUTP diphosphatase [Candidatus Improbicoccus devescovinae]|nr:MAG: dUTP diphosphatase [Candidatus Improbicoccus devescovinae]